MSVKTLIFRLIALFIVVITLSCSGSGQQKSDQTTEGSKSKGKEIKMPTGWDKNPYSWWIDGKWDSSVLPKCVPTEVDGVKPDQTYYKDNSQDVLNQYYQIGSIYFKDSNFEKWGLSFYCTDEQLNTFVKEMKTKGFYGGITNSGTYPEYEWIGNGYYAYMRVNDYAMGQEGYKNLAMFSITNDSPPRPKAFKNTKLPDFGWVTQDYTDGVGFGYNKGNDNSVENFYDIFKDSGNLPTEGWSFWVYYFGVSVEKAKEYAQNLVKQGWKITNEDTYSGGEGYSCSLEKDGIVGGLQIGGEGSYTLGVGFGSQGEYLFY